MRSNNQTAFENVNVTGDVKRSINELKRAFSGQSKIISNNDVNRIYKNQNPNSPLSASDHRKFMGLYLK
jgi:predicted site-specific integrase-resolvase